MFSTGCQTNQKKETTTVVVVAKKEIATFSQEDLSKYETAYFASGCFWCVEAIFESVKGRLRKLFQDTQEGPKKTQPTSKWVVDNQAMLKP